MNPVTPQFPDRSITETGGALWLFSFAGRSNRRTWWSVQIISWLLLAFVSGAILGIDAALEDDAAAVARGTTDPDDLHGISVVLGIGAWIAYGIVNLAVSVRRLHDHNKGGEWVLLNLVPIVGSIWLLVMLGFRKGSRSANQYGPPTW